MRRRDAVEAVGDDVHHRLLDRQRRVEDRRRADRLGRQHLPDPFVDASDFPDFGLDRDLVHRHARLLARRRGEAKPAAAAWPYCLAIEPRANHRHGVWRGAGRAMDIVHEKDGDVVIFRLSGRLDSNAAASAEADLGAAVAGAPSLAIDLSGLDYISSAGLRVMLVLARKVQQASGKLALFGLQPAVRQVFTVSGFDTIISIQPDAAAAL